ncbi:MAG: nucleotidyltransferase family protein [Rhodobacterales bacterium]|nr:nucleotidyltransferase family protein [Rhodobacterales bacterium]NCT13206.1 nucleotidyltransferase family protein [Rhodobacterales bacterium]
MTPILILAAGLSRRMRGADKLLEQVEGVPLVRRQVASAIAAGLAPWVALPGPDHPRARALAGLAHHPLVLPGSAEGMGGTLREGVAALPGSARFLIMAADLPGLVADDLATVAATPPGDALIVIATSEGGALGHPVMFDARLRPDFATLSGDEGARRIVRAHRARMLTVPLPGDHATRDLDTPEDWADWRRETGL